MYNCFLIVIASLFVFNSCSVEQLNSVADKKESLVVYNDELSESDLPSNIPIDYDLVICGIIGDYVVDYNPEGFSVSELYIVLGGRVINGDSFGVILDNAFICDQYGITKKDMVYIACYRR